MTKHGDKRLAHICLPRGLGLGALKYKELRWRYGKREVFSLSHAYRNCVFSWDTCSLNGSVSMASWGRLRGMSS